MPYPPSYSPQFNTREAAANGIDPNEVYVELSNLAESVNQCVRFIRSITTVDQKLQPNQLSGSLYVIEQEFTATAGQVAFAYLNGVTTDPATATVGVFSDGVRVDPADVTIYTDRVEIPARVGGETVVLDIHENAESLLSLLGSMSAALGASLIGIEDVNGVLAADNVEDALAENRLALDALNTAIGDLSKYLRADVAVPWEVNQNANNRRLTELADAVSNKDAVTLRQLNAAFSAIGTYLPLVGGTMTGNINMGGNSITNVVDGGGTSAMPKSALLLLDGTQAMTADLDFGSNKGVNLADGTDPTDAVNKGQLDAVEALIPEPEAAFPDGGCGLGDTAAGLDISGGGEFSTTGNTTVTAAMTPPGDVTIRVSAGNFTNTGTITIPTTYPETTLLLDVDGDVTISAAITVPRLIIRATGSVTISAAITCTYVSVDAGGALTHSTGLVTCVEGYVVAGADSSIAATWRALLENVGDTVGKLFGETPPPNTGALGNEGTGGAGGPGGGEGSIGQDPGSSVRSLPGADRVISGASRPWLYPPASGGSGGLGGGSGEDPGLGGGVVSIYVVGNLNLTGGTLDASGGDGLPQTNGEHGAGGGGVARAVCTGTLTNGTISAKGGDGLVANGSGGGGCAVAMASAYSGAVAITAAGGTTTSGGVLPGGDGTVYSGSPLYTADQILCMKPLLTQEAD